MQSEHYQDTGPDELGSQNNFIEDETASNQIFGWLPRKPSIKWAIGKIFNHRFRNAMVKLFKPCVCGREELVKEQQSDDDDDDYGAELMQDDEPDGGMNAEAEGRFSFYRMKMCIFSAELQ